MRLRSWAVQPYWWANSFIKSSTNFQAWKLLGWVWLKRQRDYILRCRSHQSRRLLFWVWLMRQRAWWRTLKCRSHQLRSSLSHKGRWNKRVSLLWRPQLSKTSVLCKSRYSSCNNKWWSNDHGDQDEWLDLIKQNSYRKRHVSVAHVIPAAFLGSRSLILRNTRESGGGQW